MRIKKSSKMKATLSSFGQLMHREYVGFFFFEIIWLCAFIFIFVAIIQKYLTASLQEDKHVSCL